MGTTQTPLGLAQAAQQAINNLLAALTPPAIPGFPAGAIQFTGTVTAYVQEQSPFGWMGVVDVTAVVNSVQTGSLSPGQSVSYRFYKPPTLTTNTQYQFIIVPSSGQGQYDTLYEATPQTAPQPLSGGGATGGASAGTGGVPSGPPGVS